MLNDFKEANKQWMGEREEFLNDYCISAVAHSLKRIEQNNTEGQVVGFDKERVCFQIGEDTCSKIICLKLENILIDEDF